MAEKISRNFFTDVAHTKQMLYKENINIWLVNNRLNKIAQ